MDLSVSETGVKRELLAAGGWENAGTPDFRFDRAGDLDTGLEHANGAGDGRASAGTTMRSMPPEAIQILIVILACCLLAALICWPRCGLWAWRRRGLAAGRQARVEDVLKHLCKTEAAGRRPTIQSVAGVLHAAPATTASLLESMAADGMVEFAAGELKLTPSGRKAGMHIIRAHRLWECYLADQTGLREGEWHARAERREHRMTPAEADSLSAALGNPTHDPHGDRIPTADGHLEPDDARPLAAMAAGELAMLAHIEDEPETLYARLAALGLRVGMTVRMLGQSDGALRFTANGDEFTLEAILANQVEVAALTDSEEAAGHLAACRPGTRATVLGLARSCRGQERRRLLDLGFVAGTEIEVAMASPSGEPTAYQVRGTLIALHREQASQVMVNPLPAQA